MNNVAVSLKRLSQHAKIPGYAYEGDAGVDLCSIERVQIKPSERSMISTGLGIALPAGYAGFVLPRSGLAAKHGISIVNAPGLIDSNYRGEIKVILVNLDPENAFVVEPGDRIAQLVVMPVPAVSFEVVDDLPDSDRGTAGFGSSGIHG